MSCPPSWPTDCKAKYASKCLLSTKLTRSQRSALRPLSTSIAAASSIPILSAPSPLVSIHQITSTTHPGHPAQGQYGLFAASHLPPNSLITTYVGYVHSSAPEDSDPNDEASNYDLSLDREAEIAIDARWMGNEGRFVNDYRGVPGRDGRGPNAEFRDVWIDIGSEVFDEDVDVGGGEVGDGNWLGRDDSRTAVQEVVCLDANREDDVSPAKRTRAKGHVSMRRVEKRIGIFVRTAGKSGYYRKGVRAGEEILVSYGKGFWSESQD